MKNNNNNNKTKNEKKEKKKKRKKEKNTDFRRLFKKGPKLLFSLSNKR